MHTYTGSILSILFVLDVLIVGEAFVVAPTPQTTRAGHAAASVPFLTSIRVYSCQANQRKTPLSLVHSTQASVMEQRNALSQPYHHDTRIFAMSLPTTTAAVSHTTPHSTYLVRICFLRGLAFVHLVAFLIALHQNRALIGDKGISPARVILDKAEARGAAKRERRLQWRRNMRESSSLPRPQQNVQQNNANVNKPRLSVWKQLQQALGSRIDQYPALTHLREVLWDRSDRNDRPTTTVLWWAPHRDNLNPWLDGIAWSGIVVSTVILLRGAANVPLVFSLWLLQKSLMNVGGLWYGYGWEPQLAELSFHTLFMVPLLSLNPIPQFPVSPWVRWTLQWHLFRVMMGAGLIKLRSGDPKWKNGTVMNYFYETQPVPNPLTRYMHWMPAAWHRLELWGNHLVELVTPWLLILPGLPTGVRRMGGMVQILFQFIIIMGGNLSFLNWLTMVPAIMCFDDALVGRFFSPSRRQEAWAAACTKHMPPVRKLVNVLFFALIVKLSVPVVKNLLSERQTMIASYDPLRLVNSYGAFGSVGEVREEWIISSSVDNENWKEYEFKVKPGCIYRPPRFISPYHHRLDWQMWLAANLRQPYRSEWIYPFLIKLLKSDPDTLKLIEHDPFEHSGERPKYIKIDAYRYRFHRPKRNERSPPYWDRTFLRQVFPTQGLATMDELRDLCPHA